MDIVAPRGEDLYFAVGGEYRLDLFSDYGLALRGGYNNRSSFDGNAVGLSAGMGFGWKGLSLDYAFVNQGDLDSSQILSLTYNF